LLPTDFFFWFLKQPQIRGCLFIFDCGKRYKRQHRYPSYGIPRFTL